MKRILIVDDEIAVATVFETALKNAGYDVKIAADAKTGLSTAKSEQFDLILMDQMMPDMSGNEALKTLKADPALVQIPVAMLTNFGHDTMVKEALNSNAADYILKYQISADDLVAKVKGLVGDAGSSGSVTNQPAQQPQVQNAQQMSPQNSQDVPQVETNPQTDPNVPQGEGEVKQ